MESRLRELRLQKKVSQGEVADAIHVTRQAYSYYENGKREPSLEIIMRLADYFGVTIDYLTCRSNVRVAPEDLQLPDDMLHQLKETSQQNIAELWQYLNFLEMKDEKKTRKTSNKKS